MQTPPLFATQSRGLENKDCQLENYLFLENSYRRKKKRIQFTTKDPKFLADKLVLIPTPKCMELQSLKNSATYKPAYSVSCKKYIFSRKQEYHSITMGMDIIYVDICGYTYRGYLWISQAFQKSKIILFSICWGPAKAPSLFTYYKLVFMLIAGDWIRLYFGSFSNAQF